LQASRCSRRIIPAEDLQNARFRDLQR